MSFNLSLMPWSEYTVTLNSHIAQLKLYISFRKIMIRGLGLGTNRYVSRH